ncbi:Geminin/Multicilin [Cinara cedri]|uniref:Geminin/Multicilin n=1 Tax=Cinara cedri TaxID=506608 RepID=A0A5E4LY91_9HEMI|nr:Geminin/Multicilin [Cinara cedri]
MVKNDKSYKKRMRKFLQNLQPSNGGKENLIGAGRNLQDNMDNVKPVQINEVEVKPKEKTHNSSPAKGKSSLYRKLILEDLTSTAGPSEKTWEVIAEHRRKALAKAIEENQQLFALVIDLKEENTCCNTLLENSTDLVKTLTGMINENDFQSNDTSSDDIEDSNLSTPGSSDEKHVHKRIKLSKSTNECPDSN